MSIVKYLEKNELPIEGQVVYCDNGEYSPDRAVYKNGFFMGGGDMSPVYKMSQVSKWFDLRQYDDYHKRKGVNCYGVNFLEAENINPNHMHKNMPISFIEIDGRLHLAESQYSDIDLEINGSFTVKQVGAVLYIRPVK